jgi:hypothetical protein
MTTDEAKRLKGGTMLGAAPSARRSTSGGTFTRFEVWETSLLKADG